MTLPGPPGVVWSLELLLWAAAAAVTGELFRQLAARWVVSWRTLDGVERMVLDLYLGGAAVFLVASLPIDAFHWGLVALPLAASVVLGLRLRARGPGAGAAVRGFLRRPGVWVGITTALALFAYELVIALPVSTGNTYDASVLTTFVALLLQHQSIPLSLAPYSSVAVIYPQGATVWLAGAQSVFGLPPARASLLVTPLFLGIVPLAAFAFGRRAFESDGAAAACAVFFAAIGSWSRVLVAGSNDFVFAFPLVLLLAGQLVAVTRAPMPPWSDALAFGLMAGYSAALNPVGAEWLLPTALLLGGLCWVRGLRDAGRWLLRWLGMVAIALLALVPTLVALASVWTGPNLTPGGGVPPPSARFGIDTAQFVGGIDPFLFRPTDVWLSPVPLLRAELAALLVVGLVVLVLGLRWAVLRDRLGPFARVAGSSIVVLVAWFGVLWVGSGGPGFGARLFELTSPSELSIWLFTWYTLLAAVPLVLLVDLASSRAEEGAAPAISPRSGGPSRWRAAARSNPAPIAIALALVIVVPGAVLSGTSLPPVLGGLYDRVGNVTADDFAMLEFAGAHLPSGARVLVAPGSAAEFLPGYATNVVLLYPMVSGWPWINASYTNVVSELTNGTLDGRGLADLAALAVGYIVVTGPNTVLWPPFSPDPLLAAPATFPVVFHAGDAYVFQRMTA